MGDYILMDGDIVMFLPAFGDAVVMVQPGTLTGSGPGTIGGNPICVEGDEADVSVPGVMYFTPVCSIPGTGTLSIAELDDHPATKTKTGKTPVLLVGGNFKALFEVQSPAQQPPPGPGGPIPDSTASYDGEGLFQTMNSTFKGT